MKFLKKLCFILSLLLVAICAFSCNDTPEPPPETTCTVTFDLGEDSYLVEVEKGKIFAKPESPTRTGYEFFGWYYGEEEWDFSSTVAMMDITLTARWEPTPYRLTYVLAGGVSTNPPEYSIVSEDILLNSPTKKGHLFLGWLIDGKGDPVSQYTIKKGSIGHKSFVAMWEKCSHPQESLEGDFCPACGSDTLVYYEEFGAVGDGVTDDFDALKRTHDYANFNGSTVMGREGATYYLGEKSRSASITVMTDVVWRNITIIIDDSNMSPTSAPIFYVCSEYNPTDFIGVASTAIYSGMKNVGFAPGRPMLLCISDSYAQKKYIRYGANANDGATQKEMILVDADGNVDPSTPIEWDYLNLTTVIGYPVDEAPLTIDGGSTTRIKTIANTAPNLYTYYGRNIYITRPNVTVSGLYHEFDETGSETRAPYNGFIRVERTHNVTVKDCVITHHKDRYLEGSGGSNLLGTYEFAATDVNKLSYVNCTQTNFYDSNGYVSRRGIMGTNGCRNMLFDGCTVSSFDAHTAAYNVTLKNSTCEHINFIGAGDILLENMTIYADPSAAGLILRSDYGSTWNGTVTINGMTLKTRYSSPSFDLIKAEYTNHYFGMQTYLPKTVTINGLKVKKYSVSFDEDGNRVEKLTDVTNAKIYIYRYLRGYTSKDISSPDGGNLNPYRPTETVYINDCQGINWMYPKTPQFKNMKVIIDGEEFAWREQ